MLKKIKQSKTRQKAPGIILANAISQEKKSKKKKIIVYRWFDWVHNQYPHTK